MYKTSSLRRLLLASLAGLALGSAQAETYPAKTISLIVPVPSPGRRPLRLFCTQGSTRCCYQAGADHDHRKHRAVLVGQLAWQNWSTRLPMVTP